MANIVIQKQPSLKLKSKKNMHKEHENRKSRSLLETRSPIMQDNNATDQLEFNPRSTPMRSSNNNDLDHMLVDGNQSNENEEQEMGMTYDEEVVKIGSRNSQFHALQYIGGGNYGETITEDQRSSNMTDSTR